MRNRCVLGWFLKNCSLRLVAILRWPIEPCQLPIFNFQLPTSNFQLPASNFQLPTSNFQLPTSYFLLQFAEAELESVNCTNKLRMRTARDGTLTRRMSNASATARKETGRDASKERCHMLHCNCNKRRCPSRLSYFKTHSFFFLSAIAKYIQQAKERQMQLRKPKGGTEKKTEQFQVRE